MLIRKNKILKYIFLFLCGGFIYGIIEIMYRGFSHISMFIAGGTCFILIGILNGTVSKGTSLFIRAGLGALLITEIEFFIGIIVNRWMGLNIWDYSHLPLNLMGQVCLYFGIVWYFVAFLAILTYDYMKYFIMNEEKPRYNLIRRAQ